jgi:hypothetical protein
MMEGHNKRFNRVLLIGYLFPPFKTVGAIRLHSLACELAHFSNEVVVLSSWNSQWVRQEVLPLPDNMKQYLIPTLDYHTLRAWIRSGKVGTTKTKPASGFMSRLLNSFPFNVLIGEGALLYVLCGIVTGILNLRKTDLIVSSFRPYADHLIARVLRMMKPKVKWVADYRDIHVDRVVPSVLWPDFQDSMHRWLLAPADMVTVVSEGYRRNIEKYHPRTVLLRNGYSDFTLQAMQAATPRPTRQFCIAYSGMLYAGRRRATLLWQALRALLDEGKIQPQHLELCYAGRDGAQWVQQLNDYNLAPYAVDLGEVSLEQSFSLQKSAAVNLLLSWSTPQGGTFPAKFFEYLLAERPILLLIDGVQDREWEQLFEQLQSGALFYNNDKSKIEQIKLFIIEQYNSWQQNGLVSTSIPTDLRDTFYWKKSIFQLLDQV